MAGTPSTRPTRTRRSRRPGCCSPTVRPTSPRPPRRSTPPPGGTARHDDTFGAAQLLWLFEAPGGDTAAAIADPAASTAAWAGGEVRLWDVDGDPVVGLSLADRGAGDPPLCGSVTDWFAAAAPGADPVRLRWRGAVRRERVRDRHPLRRRRGTSGRRADRGGRGRRRGRYPPVSTAGRDPGALSGLAARIVADRERARERITALERDLAVLFEATGELPRRRARPGGRDHRLRACPGDLAARCCPRTPDRARRGRGPRRRWHLRRVRIVRRIHRCRAPRGAPHGTSLHRLRHLTATATGAGRPYRVAPRRHRRARCADLRASRDSADLARHGHHRGGPSGRSHRALDVAQRPVGQPRTTRSSRWMTSRAKCGPSSAAASVVDRPGELRDVARRRSSTARERRPARPGRRPRPRRRPRTCPSARVTPTASSEVPRRRSASAAPASTWTRPWTRQREPDPQPARLDAACPVGDEPGPDLLAGEDVGEHAGPPGVGDDGVRRRSGPRPGPTRPWCASRRSRRTSRPRRWRTGRARRRRRPARSPARRGRGGGRRRGARRRRRAARAAARRASRPRARRGGRCRRRPARRSRRRRSR